MDRKTIIKISAGAIVAIAILGYFFVVPGKQVNSYKGTVETSQSKLNEKINKVNDILDSDTFVLTDVESSQVHADVKTGRENIKDAENTLKLVEKDLTGFSALPLLGWNGSYKNAAELKTNEQKYVDTTKEYLQELGLVLAYFENSTKLDQEFIDYELAVEDAYLNTETLPEYGAKLEEATKKIESANKKLAEIKAPKSLKEAHDYDVRSTNELIALIKEEVAAAKADNQAKVEEATLKQEEAFNKYTEKMNQYNADFIRESSLRKLDDRLSDLDRTIDRQIARL